MDILGMMKKAQALQAKLGDAREELASLEFEGRSGSGSVTLTLTGSNELKSISIDASLLAASEKEMLEDLILTAFADAKAKADAASAEKMQALTAGLPLPPGMKLPF